MEYVILALVSAAIAAISFPAKEQALVPIPVKKNETTGPDTSK